MIDVIIDDGVEKAPSEETGENADDPLPSRQQLQHTVETACREAGFSTSAILCIRFADDAAVQALNRQWRQKAGVTDILSFPMQEPDALDASQSLGDMILALPFTFKEAKRLRLPATDHILHLIVHGTLHLLGYDHIEDEAAKQMQSLEQRIMAKLGLHNPYPDTLDTMTEKENSNG